MNLCTRVAVWGPRSTLDVATEAPEAVLASSLSLLIDAAIDRGAGCPRDEPGRLSRGEDKSPANGRWQADGGRVGSQHDRRSTLRKFAGISGFRRSQPAPLTASGAKISPR